MGKEMKEREMRISMLTYTYIHILKSASYEVMQKKFCTFTFQVKHKYIFFQQIVLNHYNQHRI